VAELSEVSQFCLLPVFNKSFCGVLMFSHNCISEGRITVDTGLDQLAIAGWKMVMLGDDTWLKIFPDKFMRHDGVNSFYVRTCG
jgi:hypothetical protein